MHEYSATSTQLIHVPFRGTTLFVIDHEGQPFTLFTAKAAKPTPTPQPARPLADAEPPKATEKSLWERIQEERERQEEENRQHKGRGRSPMDDLLDAHFRKGPR